MMTSRKASTETMKNGAICSILIAEDCPDTVQLLQTYLSGPRIMLTIARTGREAIEAFKDGYFDLVLMDIGLPDMDGYAATREIRIWEAVRTSNRTPIAALTAVSDYDASSRILSAGFTMHLVKPISRQTLLQIVGQYGVHAPIARPAKQHTQGVPSSQEALELETSVRETIKALIPEYLTNLNLQVAAMAIAIEGREYAAIQSYAHKIKGSGGAFGFPKISEYAREIERAATRSDMKTLAEQVSKLHHYVESAPAEWGFTAQAH